MNESRARHRNLRPTTPARRNTSAFRLHAACVPFLLAVASVLQCGGSSTDGPVTVASICTDACAQAEACGTSDWLPGHTIGNGCQAQCEADQYFGYEMSCQGPSLELNSCLANLGCGARASWQGLPGQHCSKLYEQVECPVT